LAGALRLLAARLTACAAVALAFWSLELVVTVAASAIGGSISAAASFDADRQLLSLAPRAALGIAGGAVFAWLEVARNGALAALAANEAGLLDAPEPPAPPPRPPEPIIEALPIAEPVIEALPVEPEKKA